MRPRKLLFATISLHLASFTMVCLGTFLICLPLIFKLTAAPNAPDVKMPILIWVLLVPIFVASLFLTVVNEILVLGLNRRRKWAWALAVAAFVLYIPTFLFFFGAFGLYGLLNGEVRSMFGFGRANEIKNRAVT